MKSYNPELETEIKRQTQTIDDRKLCETCKREFEGVGTLCPDCQSDLEDIF